MNARTILAEKGGGVRSIAPDALVYTALEAMAEHKVGALMVVEGGRLVGVISERDYTRKIVLKGRSSKSTTVSEIMTADPVGVQPEATLEDCMALMSEKKVRHLPVTEEGKVLGVISATDTLDLALTQNDRIIQQLEQYIAPGP